MCGWSDCGAISGSARKVCALRVVPVHGTMISSLPAGCHRAGTCRGSGACDHSFVGDVPDSGADEHERAVAVREAAHDARAPPDLPVQPFDHVVRADASCGVRPGTPAAGRWSSRRRPRAGSSAAALSFLASISAATVPALARADSRDSMANIAFRAADAQSLWLGGAFESTLRMKCTMHRWYFASGSIEFTVETSPGAPVADHQAHALQTAFDHASYELLPAGRVLPHALRRRR